MIHGLDGFQIQWDLQKKVENITIKVKKECINKHKKKLLKNLLKKTNKKKMEKKKNHHKKN